PHRRRLPQWAGAIGRQCPVAGVRRRPPDHRRRRHRPVAAETQLMMNGAATPLLSAHGLVKRYGRVTALDHADFDLYPGEILAVIGDNGAGKSTLIKALTGAVIPDHGEIRLEGRP